MFAVNMHRYERWARVTVGVVPLSFASMDAHSLGLLLAAVPLLTGLAGRCPAYHLLGFSTTNLDASSQADG